MTADDEALPVLWQASQSRIESSNLEKFRKLLNARYGIRLETYDDLHKFSVEHLVDFYRALWDYAGIRFSTTYKQVLTDPGARPGDLPRFFEGSRLNFAENTLFPLHPKNATACMPHAPRNWPHEKTVAIFEYGEADSTADDAVPLLLQKVTWGDLRRRVAVLAEAFRRKGVRMGDRVAHVSANSSDPIVTYLAAVSIGAIFSALATDAGPQAIYGRLAQIRPRVVLTDDVAFYNGKEVNVVDRVAKVADDLLSNGKVEDPSAFEVVCLINRKRKRSSTDPKLAWKGKSAACSTLEDYLQSVGLSSNPDCNPAHRFEALPFSHPALIVFSSGTTGEPKSICHIGGGLLIKAKTENLFQMDLLPGDTHFQLTTCGWIMWQCLVSQLCLGNNIITYDGSPLFPNALAVPRLVSEHCKHQGTVAGIGMSPRVFTEMERASTKFNLVPKDRFNFDSLKIVTTTGSPLSPANARFFYEKLFPSHVQLASISGGTDLAGCLIGTTVFLPVRGHLLGGKTLGMDIRILDPITGEDCEASGEAGELTCASPFPSQPLKFWGAPQDEEALHEKYMDSYYRRFAPDSPAHGYWAQGDFISRRPMRIEGVGGQINGPFEIHGRSDGVLNPSGVRFGSAEIYAVVEGGQFPFVADSVVVGQRRPGKDDDERVLLFVKLRDDAKQAGLSKKQIDEMKAAIRTAYSPRHVPAHIFAVKDVPVTANGKKTELAVKAIVCGNTAFRPSTATANPEALDEYRQYADLESVLRQSKL